MESIGVLCDHILTIVLHLDMLELPNSLLHGRWKNRANDEIRTTFGVDSSFWDSQLIARYVKLVQV